MQPEVRCFLLRSQLHRVELSDSPGDEERLVGVLWQLCSLGVAWERHESRADTARPGGIFQYEKLMRPIFGVFERRSTIGDGLVSWLMQKRDGVYQDRLIGCKGQKLVRQV